jgi:hypothetical protein
MVRGEPGMVVKKWERRGSATGELVRHSQVLL